MPVLMEATSLDTLTTVFSWFLERWESMAGTLLTTPLFLISVGVFCIGACIGLVKRIL